MRLFRCDPFLLKPCYPLKQHQYIHQTVCQAGIKSAQQQPEQPSVCLLLQDIAAALQSGRDDIQPLDDAPSYQVSHQQQHSNYSPTQSSASTRSRTSTYIMLYAGSHAAAWRHDAATITLPLYRSALGSVSSPQCCCSSCAIDCCPLDRSYVAQQGPPAAKQRPASKAASSRQQSCIQRSSTAWGSSAQPPCSSQQQSAAILQSRCL